MKRKHMHIVSVAVVTAALMLSGCSSTKPERFHSLLAAAPTAASPAPAGAPVIIDLMPISVPALVDQPQWVVRSDDDTLQLLEQERWAAPLRDELRAALWEAWVARWGGVNARTLPQTAGASWLVRVDVLRFESIPGREARIEATWSVTSPNRAAPALVCRSAIQESAGTGGYPALAAAHRRAVNRLADEIGERLLAMKRGEQGRCK